MTKLKVKYFYGEQGSPEWHHLRLGRFTSSEIHLLFTDPTKQSRANAAMKQLKNDLWQSNDVILNNNPSTDEKTYAGKYLSEFGILSKPEVVGAKANIKGIFSGKLSEYSTEGELLLRACYAIKNVDIVSASVAGYAKDKALEIIYGEPKEDTKKIVAAMEWGKDCEPLARQRFEKIHFEILDEKKIGFAFVQGLATGTSPDDTLNGRPVEYKCPKNRGIHYDHIMLKDQNDLFAYDKQKFYQIQHQIWILGAEFGFWCSFDPRCLRNPKNSAKALKTIKIFKDYAVCSEFESRIMEATKVRDQFVSEFYAQKETNF